MGLIKKTGAYFSTLKTIAEYIHNEKVQKKIEEMGINYSQGYYIGEPKETLTF